MRETKKDILDALANIGIFPPESDIEGWGVTGGEPMECPTGDTLTDALRWTCDHIGQYHGAKECAALLRRRAKSQSDEGNLEAARHTENSAVAIEREFQLVEPLRIVLVSPSGATHE